MSTSFDLANPNRTIHVGVPLLNGTTELLDVAPVDLLMAMSKEKLDDFPDQMVPSQFRAQALDMKVHWITETGEPAKLSPNVIVQPTDTFATCPPLDIVLIGASDSKAVPTDAELAYLRQQYEHCSAFVTICGGLQAALRSGIMAGKTVTGPRMMLEELRPRVPNTTFVEKRWHRDGKLWTSGTLLNGIDLVRSMMLEIWGAKGEASLADFALKLGGAAVRENNFGNLAERSPLDSS